MKLTPEEEANRRNIIEAQKKIKQEYIKAIDIVFASVQGATLGEKAFRLSEYPKINEAVTRALKSFRINIEAILVNGIDKGFLLSQKNFIDTVYSAYDGRAVIDQVKSILNATYEKPLQAFLDRSINGLKLSDRVWNLTRQFQREIEWSVFAGLSEAQSAQIMSRSIRRFLNNPDKLFRRVRNAEGRLVLSKAAKAFNPGQGVYRSSYKNAMRVARTEINTAYRTADHLKYKETPFVLGVEIRLSEAHPVFDMCDLLVGNYPAWFKFTGWHIQCICYQVPILPSKEEFRAYQRALLNDEEYVFKGKINEVPKKAFDWVSDNAKRLKGYKTLPTFMLDNREVFMVPE
jgi:hypothetical protein